MLKSTYTPPPPLPPGWTEHRAPSGHIYYYNAETKQSTYTRPQAPTLTAPQASQTQAATDQLYTPETLPPFSSTPYGPAGFGPTHAFPGAPQRGHGRGTFRGGRGYQDRRQREPADRPKSKHAIPGCAPWVLVKTRLGRRFVYNSETDESFWKFPPEVLKGVVEFDRLEREKKERQERGEEDQAEEPVQAGAGGTGAERSAAAEQVAGQPGIAREGGGADDDSDEYEEVEVTDSEAEDTLPPKRTKSEPEGTQQVEFTEEDIEYQLAAMGEDYGLDPGEYGEPGEEGWEEGAEGLPLTDEDARALFRDLLDDHHINPFTPWETIIEEGRIIEDNRYTVLPTMKARHEVWSEWSRQRIQEVREQKAKQEKQDPRIPYLALLQEHATPKLYWPEFKRKYRREASMKDPHLSDKDREKYYRDHISRLKLPESTRKSDLSALLKSIPLQLLNRSSNVEALPPAIVTDLRYISLPPKVRDSLIEAYIATLPAAPAQESMSAEEQQELERKKVERDRRERALAEREKRVEDEKRRQRTELQRGRHLLKEGEAEIAEAMKIRKDGLRSYVNSETQASGQAAEKEV